MLSKLLLLLLISLNAQAITGAQRLFAISGSVAIPKTQLLMHFPASDDYSDSSSYANTGWGGNTFGKITSASGAKFGSYGYYPNGGSYVVKNTTPGFILGASNWTIEFWIKTNNSSYSTYGFICTSGASDAGSKNYFDFWYDSGNGVAWRSNGGAIQTITMTNPLSDTNFHHMALINNAGTITYYLDGVPTGSTFTDNVDYNTTGEMAIGRTYSPAGGIAGYIGAMDEIRISNVARWTADFSGSLPSSEYTSD